jgi:hypothetical protein
MNNSGLDFDQGEPSHLDKITHTKHKHHLEAPGSFIRPELINAPSGIVLRMTFLHRAQKLLDPIVITMPPVDEFSIFTLGCLPKSFHKTVSSKGRILMMRGLRFSLGSPFSP